MQLQLIKGKKKTMQFYQTKNNKKNLNPNKVGSFFYFPTLLQKKNIDFT